ncbi:hypothetical protein OAO18_00325 [Francisellaceae bacterium]|nr:hypothetical protein [Francisellaceae bacterium]
MLQSLKNTISDNQSISLSGLNYNNVEGSHDSFNTVSGAGIHFIHTIGSETPVPGKVSNGWVETFQASNGENIYSDNLEGNAEYAGDFN